MKDEQREIIGLDLSAGGCTIHYAPANCAQCGKPVEEERRCYAIPTCYACLPPPEPLPVRPVSRRFKP
jgi:hypothetical protein